LFRLDHLPQPTDSPDVIANCLFWVTKHCRLASKNKH